MDPWKEISAWERARDHVRRWSALEGKSATMQDDLYRGRLPRTPASRSRTAWLGAWIHVSITIVEAWRYCASG